VAALSGIVVVVALLIHAAAANRPFALPDADLRFVDGIVPSGAIEGLFSQPRIGNVGFSLEGANLLLVGSPALVFLPCIIDLR
jgi:hypothetical protein